MYGSLYSNYDGNMGVGLPSIVLYNFNEGLTLLTCPWMRQ